MFQYYRTLHITQRLQYSDNALIPLVDQCTGIRTGYNMFVSISPNPNTKHSVYREIPFKTKTQLRKIKIKYSMMTHEEQYKYLIDYIEKVYVPLLDKPQIVGVMELNKEAHLHCHFILKSVDVVNDTTLAVFRRNIMTDLNTTINMSKNGRDYMNNIVKITKPIDEVITYMSKDNDDVRPLFKNYFLSQ